MITKHELIKGTTQELAEYFHNLTEESRKHNPGERDDKAKLLIHKDGFLIQLDKINTLVSLLFYLDVTEKKSDATGEMETNMELKSSYVHIEDKKIKK